jgi:signal peptidase I
MVHGTGLAIKSASRIWRTIWFHPQTAIKSFLEHPHSWQVVLLAASGGIVAALIVVGATFAELPSPTYVALLCGLGGAAFGIAALYGHAALLAAFGGFLDGAAGARDFRAAIAWSQAPLLILLCCVLGALAVYGMLAVRAAAFGSAGSGAPVLPMLGPAFWVAICWSGILLVRSVGAVQGFGFVKATINASFLLLLLLCLSPILARLFVYQPFSIPAGAMSPTILAGDYIVANKFAYGYGRYSFPLMGGFMGRILEATPRRGDLVIFRLPSDGRTDYIKRVVGLPGDRIQMIGGVLRINGEPVQVRPAEDFIGTGSLCNRSRKGSYKVQRELEILPNGVQYATLNCRSGAEGDNTAVFEVPVGHYFMMGDNRDNSNDSRFGVGFVPYENLIARVSLIVFSISPDTGEVLPDRMLQVPQ